MELHRDVVSRGFEALTSDRTKFLGRSHTSASGGDSLSSRSISTWCRDHDENRRGPQRDSAHHQRLFLGHPHDGYTTTTSQGTQQQQQQQQQHEQQHEQQQPEQPPNQGDQQHADASAYYPRGNRNKPVKWSPDEDRRLREAVDKFSEARWKDIARMVETRNHVQCLQRWKKVLKPGLVKGQWSPEEDDQLVRLVERGFRNWGQVASFMDGRTSKQCRERWCHHLDPGVRKGGYTREEDELIVCLQREVGNRWADIAKRLTGRTENAVKIRWKALNRRQRDARNKATSPGTAGAAAVADDGGTGENMEQPNSTLSVRPGPESRDESTSTQECDTRPAPRSTNGSMETTSAAAITEGSSTMVMWEQRCPTVFVSKNDKRDYSRVGAWSSGFRGTSESGTIPSAGREMPAPADCAMFPSTKDPRGGEVEAERPEFMSGQSRDLCGGVQSSAAGSGGGKWIPLDPEPGIRRDAHPTSLDRRDPAYSAGRGAVERHGTCRAPGPSPTEINFPPRRGLGTSATRGGREGRGGGGLHRLCAAMRNVEAMDNLQLLVDDEAVDAAAAAAAERFRMPRSDGGPYGAPRAAEEFGGGGSLTKRSTLESPYPLRFPPRLMPPLRAPLPQVSPLSATDKNCIITPPAAHGPSSATAAPHPPRASADVSPSVPGASSDKAHHFPNTSYAAQPPSSGGAPEEYSTVAPVGDRVQTEGGWSHGTEARHMATLTGRTLGFHHRQHDGSAGPSRSKVDGGATQASVTCCKRPRNGHPTEASCKVGGEVGSRGRDLRTVPSLSKKARSISVAPPPLPPSSTAVAARRATATSAATAVSAVKGLAPAPTACSRTPSASIGGVTSNTCVAAVSSAPCAGSYTTTAS